MITQDLRYWKEEGYIRYRTPTVYYMPPYNIYNILNVMSGDAFYYAPATFANKYPLVFKFIDMQVRDNIRFIFYENPSPITEGSKLPVLSMKIDGVETLLPSKIPQIKENVYTAYVDYPITQNMNDIKISLSVRNDISSNGTTILQEPPNVCTEGLICIDVKRADKTPPIFNIINISNITSDSFSLNISCNEDATAYYKLLNSVGTIPTSAELKATHDAEIVLTANVLSTINASELSPSTDYDLYVVAEDTEHNLQVTPTKISFSTTIGKISEIEFNIDFDKTQLGTFIEVKYLDIKASGGSILYKNPIVKYWNNYVRTVRVFDKEGETFGSSLDLYFQIECDGYKPSDVIHKELRMIQIDGYHGGYSGGGSYEAHYAYHNNDNYKKSEARILIPLTNTSFISYKK